MLLRASKMGSKMWDSHAIMASLSWQPAENNGCSVACCYLYLYQYHCILRSPTSWYMRMKLSIQLRITQCYLTGAPCCLKEIRPWLNWLELKEATPAEDRNSLFLRSQVWIKIGYLNPKIVFPGFKSTVPWASNEKTIQKCICLVQKHAVFLGWASNCGRYCGAS